jgi:MFS family permease
VKAALELLKAEPRARVFFAAQAQSAFGTGAGYIAVLLVAYERFHSPWAITCVLLAEFLPAMFLGPFVGAAADRWSRKWLLVGADVIRAAAFGGLALAGSFEATVAFALLAGVGNATFNPTVMATLPSLVRRGRHAAATSLYNTISELGFTAGPALAGLAFVFVGAETLMVANALSFALSGGALALLRFCGRTQAPRSEPPTGLLRGAWSGVSAVAGDRGLRSLLLAGGVAVISMGMINVGELLLVRDALGLGDSEFSILVAVMGAGIAAGSLTGSSGGTAGSLKQRFLFGLWLCSAAAVAAGLAPGFAVALIAFAAMGIGNGLALTYEGVLLQSVVPDELLGRLFGVKNALVSWCFAAAFFSAGAISSIFGPRALFVLAGAGTLAAWAFATVALRKTWTEAPAEAPLDPAPRLRDAVPTPAEAFST